jgi:hypothetical protein
MAIPNQSSGHHAGAQQAGRDANQRLAGGEAHRDPERLEMGGKRLHADSTLRQPIGPEVDDDGLNAEQHR